MSSANNPFVVVPEPRRSTDRQVKAAKGQSILAVGFQRFRTLSGVSQKRFRPQRPLIPPDMPVSSSERQLSSFTPVCPPEPKQELAPSSIEHCDSPPLDDTDLDGSTPFPPCVSHLQGIHFVRDANQDPNLDADESTMSWTQSPHSEKSSAISASEDTNNRLRGRSHSFSVAWSERPVSPSPMSVTTSEDSSSMSDSSLISRILEKIPPKLLSVRSHGLSSSIDSDPSYAPYAPTSPLSASHMAISPLPVRNTSTLPFNIRNALRSTLPSKTPKVTVKSAMLQQRQTTQDQQITCGSSGFESSSSHTVCSPKTLFAVDPVPLGSLTSPANGYDQCNILQPGSSPSVSNRVAPKIFKSEVITEKLEFSGKFDYRRRHSISPAAPSSIPFPGSDQEEEVAEPPPQRCRSQSSTSQFRNHFNHFWSLPIHRLRTPSSLSSVMRGIRLGKRRNPSEASFEARPSSIRTESSYEILDSSAIPHI